jgi:hypothetical protein
VFPARLYKFCDHHYQNYCSSTMSSSISGQTSTLSSDFKSILDAGLSLALGEYKNMTGKPLLDHPLATELQRCDSIDAIKAVFQVQAEAFKQFRDGDKRLMKWINPVVDVLSTFSDTIGGTAGIVRPRNTDRVDLRRILTFNVQGFPPAGAIFSAIGVLLAVRIFAAATHGPLLSPTFYRQQKM